MSRIMTVGEVRKALAEYPDDLPVVIERHDSYVEYDICFDIERVYYSHFSPAIHDTEDGEIQERTPCVRIAPDTHRYSGEDER